MQIALTELQARRMRAVLIEFNRLTNQRWTLEKFINYALEEMIADHEDAAAKAARIRGQCNVTSSAHVY